MGTLVDDNGVTRVDGIGLGAYDFGGCGMRLERGRGGEVMSSMRLL